METVYDGIKAVCDANSIELETKGSGSFLYISSIGGQKEYDGGPLSGWVYAKNGVYATVGVGGAELSPGDFIWLYYSVNLGADFQELLSSQ